MDTPCPSGQYCPPATQFANQYDCPARTFYNATGAKDISDCIPCTPGYYCALSGLTYPTAQCESGWYCAGNASASQEALPYGAQCQAGFYCPQGSYQPTQCDPGTYCGTPGLPLPTANCSAGKSMYKGVNYPLQIALLVRMHKGGGQLSTANCSAGKYA